jgi:integrase
MKFTKDVVDRLTLPPGKTDHIAWDEGLPGFGIRLRAGGGRTFIVQYRAGHVQRRETLGDVRKLDLEQARRAAKRRLGAVALGHDPAAEKAEALAKARNTFAAVLPRFLERKRASVRPRSWLSIELNLVKRWAPLHALPLHKIDRRVVAHRLAELEAEYGVNSARTARIVLASFFTWAMREGLVDANPVTATNQLPPPKARERVLDDSELAAVWHGCSDLGDFGTIIRLLMLTGARRDEISELRWDEFDGSMLRIPGERTKNGRPLVLPLPPLALSIFEAIPFCRLGRDRRVFGRGRGGFGAWSQSKALLDARIAVPSWRLHDLRRTFASGLARLGVEIATIEQCLNHRSGTFRGIVAVYQRHDFIPEKRRALALWADHLRAITEGGEHQVVSLRSAS